MRLQPLDGRRVNVVGFARACIGRAAPRKSRGMVLLSRVDAVDIGLLLSGQFARLLKRDHVLLCLLDHKRVNPPGIL